MAETKKKKEEIVWDKKKILIFATSLILLGVLLFELKAYFLPAKVTISQQSKISESVKGESTENLPDLRQSISDQINNLKNEAQNINITDVATSSPQVQKVINDLKSLQNLPQSQFKEACEKVCNGL